MTLFLIKLSGLKFILFPHINLMTSGFVLKDFIYLLLERGERREKERERNSNVLEIHQSVISCTPPAGDLAHNPGMCPDWELNQRLFGSQAGTQSTEPHQPEDFNFFFNSQFSWHTFYNPITLKFFCIYNFKVSFS